MELKIMEYNLAKSKDFRQFLPYKLQLLHLLSSTYGNKYWGDERYASKINKKNLSIILAFHAEILVGCLIIKSYEKLSGLAVLGGYRRKGIATELITLAKQKFDYLYGEVSVKSLDMKKLLEGLSFKKVNDIDTLETLTAKQKDTITPIDINTDYISYIHGSSILQVDRSKEFIIYYYENE